MAGLVDPKLAINFAVVVECGSISAGARALDVAQPWLSEQIRKLELQVGDRLLIRTSRKMELTDLGRDFYNLARTLHIANVHVQEFAAAARQSSDQMVVVGATHFTIGFPERVALFHIFQQRNPNARLQIESGQPEEILQRLRAGELDIALVNDNSLRAQRDLASAGLGKRFGHIVLPIDHPLAGKQRIQLKDLAGARIAVSPGRTDIASRQAALHPLIALGVQLVAAPDEDRRLIEQFALSKGLPSLRWSLARLGRKEQGNSVVMPIEGDPIWTEIAIFRRAKDQRGKIVRFFSAAAEELRSQAPAHER